MGLKRFDINTVGNIYHFGQGVKDYIRANARKMSFSEIAEQTGLTINQVKGYIYRHKLKDCIKYKGYTESEDQFLRDNYLKMTNDQMAGSLGRSHDSIRQRRARLGLQRTKKQQQELIRNLENNGRFQPGSLPVNTLEDGAITIRRDTTGNRYKYIRLSLGKWDLYHRYLWEKKNGKVPEGMCLRCINGSSTDASPDNWELISRSENLEKNNGREDLTDNYIATILSRSDKELRNELLSYPDLLDFKRKELLLKRTINECT